MGEPLREWLESDDVTTRRRDPARITRMLTLLANVWARHPQMRLGQLLEIANDTPSGLGPDLFNAPDERLFRLLGQMLDGTHRLTVGR